MQTSSSISSIQKSWFSFTQIIIFHTTAATLLILIFISCGKKHDEPMMLKSPVTKTITRRQTHLKNEITEIPILCYHNFTENKNTDITLSRSRFEEQVQTLADRGYHTILPNDIYEYLTSGNTLPSKPIMLSFDDSRKAQYTIAEPILKKFGFTATFFIMTICIDKQDYLSSANLKELDQKGYCIAAHTYDHPMMKHVKNGEWKKELLEPKLFLEKILGHPVYYFAYPYGTWTIEAVTKLKEYGYKAAFQLSEKRSDQALLFTIRRLMVEGKWTAKALQKHIEETFPTPQAHLVAMSK